MFSKMSVRDKLIFQPQMPLIWCVGKLKFNEHLHKYVLMHWFWSPEIDHCRLGTSRDNQLTLTTRWFSNHESRLLSRTHTFAIIVILDLKVHQSMWIHWSFFQKLEPKVIDPYMTFDPMSVEVTCMTLPKDHCVQVPWQYINVCGYSDAKYHIHTHTTYILHTTYRMSDHIVSYWTQFRRDKKLNAIHMYRCESPVYGTSIPIKGEHSLVIHLPNTKLTGWAKTGRKRKRKRMSNTRGTSFVLVT